MKFSEYQTLAQETDQVASADVGSQQATLIPLLGMVGEAGQLLTEFKKRLRDGPRHEHFEEKMSEELGDILWYMANLASKYGLDLDEVAQQNLRKTRRHYGLDIILESNLDDGYNASEQFPRKIVIGIEQKISDGRAEVFTVFKGRTIGAALTDNAYEDDGYRFHDVFHGAYAAILGLSPVLRGLLRLKRKSHPRVDEVEDGGRAAVIEEGIAALVFDYARRHAFLDGVVELDEGLLTTIEGMSRHLEVSACGPALWRRAIIEGYQVWREVVANSGGTIEADLDSRTIRYIGPESAIATAAAVASV